MGVYEAFQWFFTPPLRAHNNAESVTIIFIDKDNHSVGGQHRVFSGTKYRHSLTTYRASYGRTLWSAVLLAAQAEGMAVGEKLCVHV